MSGFRILADKAKAGEKGGQPSQKKNLPLLQENSKGRQIQQKKADIYSKGPFFQQLNQSGRPASGQAVRLADKVFCGLVTFLLDNGITSML